MAAKKVSDERLLKVYGETGTTGETARKLKMDRRAVSRRLGRLGVETDHAKLLGQLGGLKTINYEVPKTGVKRYIITSAQNNTKVNKVFWDRLLDIASFYKADVIVCPFTYSPVTSRTLDLDPWYDPEVQEYLVSERIKLAPGLILCGEVTRTLPTAARPLSGYETYTGRASSIFPHAKIAMETVPSMKDEQTKFMYTTSDRDWETT